MVTINIYEYLRSTKINTESYKLGTEFYKYYPVLAKEKIIKAVSDYLDIESNSIFVELNVDLVKESERKVFIGASVEQKEEYYLIELVQDMLDQTIKSLALENTTI